MQHTTKTAFSLIRFSTDRQQFGTSKARQIDRCRAECERRGWEFDERLCITDLGVSAYKGKNFQPKFALGKFIEASKRGLLPSNAVLIVENPDRFSRAQLDDADFELWSLVKRGVDVLFLSNGLILSKDADSKDPNTHSPNSLHARVLLAFEFSRSHGESQRKSEMICSAIKRKLQLAEEGVELDFGPWQPSWIDFIGNPKQPGRFQLNDKAEIVRKTVQEYLEGASMIGIARKFNESQLPTLVRGHWSQGQVKQLLESEHLIGTATINGKRLERYYPAVISQQEWDTLRVKLAEGTWKRGGGGEIRNLFRNLCTCSHCGGNITIHESGRNNKTGASFYYKCTQARVGRCGARRLLPSSAIEQDFFGVFLKQNPIGFITEKDLEYQNKISKIKTRIVELDARIASAVELVGIISNVELKSKLEVLEKERTELKATMDKEARAVQAMHSAPGAFSDLQKLLVNPDSQSLQQANQVSLELTRQLSDPSIRKQLLGLVPSILSELIIDVEVGRYVVCSLSGEKSEWRDVSPFFGRSRRSTSFKNSSKSS